MSPLWQTVLAIIGSIGGAGGIIIALSSWLGKVWADRLMQRQIYDFKAKIENLKSDLENKNYISRTRFDMEFQIYGSLTDSTLEMVFTTGELFPRLDRVPPDIDKKRKLFEERYIRVVEAYNLANKQIQSKAPFIPKNIYELFCEIRNDCRDQISDYEIFVLAEDANDNIEEMRKEYRNCFKNTSSINEKKLN